MLVYFEYNNSGEESFVTLWGLYLLGIFLLPLVAGVLRFRLGAAWELSTLITISLIPFILVKQNSKRSVSFALEAAGVIFFISFINISGYITYAHGVQLDEMMRQQIFNIEVRIIAESVRLFACFAIFRITLIFVNTIERAAEAVKWFVLAAIAQAVYGLYEFCVKITGLSRSMPLLKPREGAYIEIPRVYGTFFEPSQFGQFMLVSIFMTLILVHLTRFGFLPGDRFVRFRVLILALLIAMLALSVSRTAFAVALAVLLVKVTSDVISLSRRRLLSSGKWILAYVLVVSVGIYLVMLLVPYSIIDAWLFKTIFADANTLDENTGLARISGAAEYASEVLRIWLMHPLGIGEGMAIVEYGSLPFIFRLAMELGPIPFIGYVSTLIYIFTKVMANGARLPSLLPAYFAVVMIQFNYNTTNNAWIWFVMALLLGLSNLLGNAALARQGARL